MLTGHSQLHVSGDKPASTSQASAAAAGTEAAAEVLQWSSEAEPKLQRLHRGSAAD